MPCRFPIRRIMLLEFSQYLELYLWPNFNPGRLSPAYIMSIVMIINEKFRQKVPVWKVFRDHPNQVSYICSLVCWYKEVPDN